PNSLPLYPHVSGSTVTVNVLDGGLGTTLELLNSLDISHTPLWSAKAAIEHPEAILEAHLAFLRAGAQIILTSTYQSGYSSEDAREIMSKCVRLALTRERDSRLNGAGLSPAQEFDGYYPPPFGPRGYTPEGGNSEEEEATAALARFHFERLCVFADDEAVWDTLDFIAFETVPLVREIRAIRMAMADLEKKTVKRKPWWISFVFLQGNFPETNGDARVPVRSLVNAAIQNPAGSGRLPVPSALGINCTEMGVIPGILAEMEAAVLAECPAIEHRPWLVLYPNGGDTYDPVSQTWVVRNTNDVWAEKLGELVAKIQSDSGGHGRIWPGVVVGGCCRTGPRILGHCVNDFKGNEYIFDCIPHAVQ
ncbi:Homocysteine S-methyltransferase, partial [Mycena galopus ATCC 62051]